VNALCGERADTFAILLRAALAAYLLLERKDREHTPEREERLIQSLAKLDLKATEFDNPNAIEDRFERECRLE
jgi:hypothetical protein